MYLVGSDRVMVDQGAKINSPTTDEYSLTKRYAGEKFTRVNA